MCAQKIIRSKDADNVSPDTKGKVPAVKKQQGNNGKQPRCIAVAGGGIQTSVQFANLMSLLIADILEERIDPRTANAAINAGGKLLKVVEMQMRYGQPVGTDRVLQLSR